MSNQSNSNNTISATESSQEEQNITREQTAANESDNSSSSSEGIPIIADKAKCKCAGANDPNALVGINVLSQSKILVNEGSVLAATTNDKTVASLNFGTCKITRSTCNANIEWQNAYADTQILGSLQILTMNSFGMCSIGGKVEFATCGQSERITPASTKDIIGIEMQQMSEENTTASAEEVLSEINSDLGVDPLADSMNAVLNQIEDVVIETLEAGAGDSKAITSITPITYPQSKTGGTVKQPKNVLCTFKGAASGTYHWKIRNESMSVLKEAEGAGQITIRFPKVGRYVIEAYQTRSYVKDNTTIAQIDTRSGDFKNALIINVVENELTLNANKTKCPINDTVNIKVEKLFDTIDIDAGQISYQVLSQGIPLADTTKAEVTGNHQAATAKFKASGSYVVQGTSSRGLKINSTESITIDALSVKNVTANNESKYTARKGENFELKAQLNYDTPENQQRVKWEVYYSETENGTKTKCHPIVGGAILNNKPPIALFTQTGFYFVYAFCATTKTESVKTVVNICQPQFVSVQWQDLNGNNIKELGKREEVYAHIMMEGVSGLSLKFEVYCLQTNKLIEDMSIAQMQSNKAIYKLKLSDNAISELKEGNKLYIKPSIRDNNNVNIVNKDKAPSDYPITYTTKEKITSLTFYADQDCKKTIASATYGNIIYARVLTRNLSGKALELYMYRNTPGKLWGTNDIELYEEEETVNDNGYAIFKIKIEKDWKKENTKDSYFAAVTEKGDNFWKEKGVRNWDRNDTAENEFDINRNLQFLRLTDQDSDPMAQNKTITTVNQVSTSNGKTNCPRCKKFTEENFKQIFSEVKKLFQQGTNELKSTTIKDFADILDKAFNEFNIDNCNRKIHFLTQISCETGNFVRIDENLNYSKAGLTKTRVSFWPEKDYPKLYASDFDAKFVNKPEALANYVYGDKGGNGNEASGDGYKYRGRGLIQLTFKNNYKLFEDYLVKKGEIEENTIINNPDLLLSNINYLVRSAAWFWKYGKSGNGTDRLNINTLADKGNITKVTLWTHGNISTLAKRVEKYKILHGFYNLGLCNFYMNNLSKDCIIDYHVYHNATFKKYIPKGIDEKQIFQYRYYYHDSNDLEHFVLETIAIESKKYDFGKKTKPEGTVVTRKNNKGENIYFKLLGGKAILVCLPKDLDIKIGGVIIKYKTNTVRNYSDPKVCASIIGALAECSYEEIVFNGCTCWEGIGDPSVTHAQGFNTDFRYIRTDKNTNLTLNIGTSAWTEMNKERQNTFNKALKKFGWLERLSNTTNIKLEEVKHDAYHGDHLHNQKYEIKIESEEK